MSNLRISLSDVSPDGLDFDFEVPVSALRPQDAEALPMDKLTVRGLIEEVGGDYLLRGTLEGVFRHACDRCLEEAEFPLAVDIFWSFQEGPPESAAHHQELEDDAVPEEEGPEFRTYQGNEIDLGPHLWEELLFAYPYKFVCNDDCKGLCAVCGVNRNLHPCNCEAVDDGDFASNSGFAGLADLFPDLRKSKEE